jgi:transcriptional regulator with XRE-family HTH domain
MARISAYQNAQTEEATQKIEALRKEALALTLEQIEKFQMQQGISDKLLAAAIGAEPSAISRWKHGKQQLSDNNLIALYLLYMRMADI